ncbi:hypothetical protein [Halosimplex pelagicum]|uniref:Uncharacterized protein n=1 Tax=Halosimplex pelagicum TaxID=869886 RepID=A0A7D5TBE9_9EURY|nr:hypothetical protein [Halosimplex pelagicum]QLH82213.1 hypothetical protein HZS54_11605 [Halosimplex pelagicum]
MIPDRLTHRQHEDETALEREQHTDHPVLASYTIAACSRDDCRYYELRDYAVNHDVELSFDLGTRLDTLTEKIDLPVIHTYHTAGGHHQGKKAFQTRTEADAYIFGSYGGTGNRNATGHTIRKTYSRTNGTHSQTARRKDYPMVCAIIDTYQDKPVYSNLVPRRGNVPESAPHWQKSVEQKVEYHLNPPEHIVSSKLREDDEFARTPDDYDGDALTWHVEQVAHWKVQIQTPATFLNSDELQIAAEHTDG